MTYRILVTGWRSWPVERANVVQSALEGIVFPTWELYGETSTIVHGACPYGGVDQFAADWAYSYKVDETHIAVPEAHPAELFGPWPACGPKRNQHMVSLGADICLGFPGPDSRGTWDCLRRAATAGIRCVVFPLNDARSPRLVVPAPTSWAIGGEPA